MSIVNLVLLVQLKPHYILILVLLETAGQQTVSFIFNMSQHPLSSGVWLKQMERQMPTLYT